MSKMMDDWHPMQKEGWLALESSHHDFMDWLEKSAFMATDEEASIDFETLFSDDFLFSIVKKVYLEHPPRVGQDQSIRALSDFGWNLKTLSLSSDQQMCMAWIYEKVETPEELVKALECGIKINVFPAWPKMFHQKGWSFIEQALVISRGLSAQGDLFPDSLKADPRVIELLELELLDFAVQKRAMHHHQLKTWQEQEPDRLSNALVICIYRALERAYRYKTPLSESMFLGALWEWSNNDDQFKA